MALRLGSDFGTQPAGVLVLRFAVAGLMLFHGVAKLVGGIDPIVGMVTQVGLPAWFGYGVFIGEVIAPLLVLAGVWVMPAALVMVVNMVVAVGLAHRNELFAIGKTGGYALELQALFLFGSLAIALLAGRRR